MNVEEFIDKTLFLRNELNKIIVNETKLKPKDHIFIELLFLYKFLYNRTKGMSTKYLKERIKENLKDAGVEQTVSLNRAEVYSHRRLEEFVRNDILIKTFDKKDKRKKIYLLSQKGEMIFAKIRAILN